VYVSFSGGKDSTVLLHLARSVFPDIPAVFVDTGLEFPEIRSFVKTMDNVTWLKPKLTFKQVIAKYGYPLISKDVAQKIYELRTTKSQKLKNKRLYGDDKGNGKVSEKWKYLIDAPFTISHHCCTYLKKNPVKKFEKESGKKPLVGYMIGESTLRSTAYRQQGCNAFTNSRPISSPIAFWTEEDIWNYIKTNDLDYSSIYNQGYDRTGCMFCCFGVHLEKKPNRFQIMKKTHPKLYDYCLNKLGLKELLDYIKVEYI
jgi:3'-phosphoadenosine 5'-phosphosulfate sulfotransferase (PAPS reductase)/FAD synthetase